MVIRAFSAYQVEQRVTNPSVISAVQASYLKFVVRVPNSSTVASGPDILSTDRLLLTRDDDALHVITIEDLVVFLTPDFGRA